MQVITGGSTGNTPAIYARNGEGNGIDVGSTYISVVGRAPANGFPLVATDPGGTTNLFYVDGAGKATYHGGLFHAMAIGARGQALAYGATTTTPTVEDTGSAQLVNGSATVPLDRTFAQTIDSRRTYQVLITPDGDTRGLYVASKSATAFVVREVQGGRGNFGFDYHIYASEIGHAGERMTMVSGSSLPRPMHRASTYPSQNRSQNPSCPCGINAPWLVTRARLSLQSPSPR